MSEKIEAILPPSEQIVTRYEVSTSDGRNIPVEMAQSSTRVEKPEDFVLTGEHSTKAQFGGCG